jgi:hypothetical protein
MHLVRKSKLTSPHLHEVRPDDRINAILEAECLLDLGIRLEARNWHHSSPHGTTRKSGSDFAADELVSFRPDTVSSNHKFSLKLSPISELIAAFLALALKLVDNAAAILKFDAELLNLVKEHLVNQRPHLE